MTHNHPEPASDGAAKRASDADRDRVVERLRDAAAEGRLDLTEFEERMDVAYRARTYGELDRLTGDLPEVAGIAPPAAEAALRAHGSTVRREGRWAVPRRLVVEVEHGAVRLDLTSAVALAAEIEIHVEATHSSVLLLVPEGTHAAGDDLSASWSAVKYGDQDYGDAGPRSGPAGLRLRLTGSAHHSSISVRRPTVFDLGVKRLRAWWRRLVRAG